MATLDVTFLVVGGGPAATAAIRSYREHGGEGKILMITADPEPPYERPPLSKHFLRGEQCESDLRLVEPGELRRLDAETRVTSVTHLDPETRSVTTADGLTVTYARCLLATGATPARLPVPGAEDPSIHQLRTLDDARRLRAHAKDLRGKAAVVVGSGFIGCEVAVSLARLGVDVSLVSDEPAPQQRRLGSAAAARIAGWLHEEKVTLVAPGAVSSFEVGPSDTRVLIQEGSRSVSGRLVVTAVGAGPESFLAEKAGLVMEGGRVRTDAFMRTSAPGVLAAGDVALAENILAGRHLAVEHWGEALAMGEIAGRTAADELAGREPSAGWAQAPGFWSEIGDHMLKYVAWGDGYADARLVDHGAGAFTVWYTDQAGVTVGVLTHQADDDYERGRTLIEQGAAVPAETRGDSR